MSQVDIVTLSHWHRDHSGGLLSAIKLINQGRPAEKPVLVDVPPDRPAYRGVMFKQPISLEADPTLQEIEAAGGKLDGTREVRTTLDGMFLVSGEIPRQTEYESGIRGGIRFEPDTGKWETDELIKEERFIMCKIKGNLYSLLIPLKLLTFVIGKGVVIFTGCSHAGLINLSRYAKQLDNGPIYAIVGGYHLADASQEKMRKSMDDLKELSPALLMPGHCTGWRFKALIDREMPGQMAPIFGGTKYNI